MIAFKLLTSVTFFALLQCLASAFPIPVSSSLRRGAPAKGGSWAFNSPIPNDSPSLHSPPIPNGPLPPHGKSRSEGIVYLPAPPKGVPRRKGGYSGPGGHGRRNLDSMREVLHSIRSQLIVRGPAWEGERPGNGNLPPVTLPPFPKPAPVPHVPGNWSGTAPQQGNIPAPVKSKGVPRRKGGYFGPGGHGRRSLEALSELLHDAPSRLLARAAQGSWAYTNPPKNGDLPPINLPPMPRPSPPGQGGGNYSGPGPHEGVTTIPVPVKGIPRRKGGYNAPGGHGR
ncbi:hypothetical protein BCV69DRAFT_297386 [Microstroma glucosiphilum]|uniref:Uncharacterized protein n=1 Tax=Pseudomicrostroma glucosiphilum TaxID=1684307 RepID=A0A316UA91_9BASI|nr:hypothetical protein BCV69DRAFT_297386 [Pseudomicrostroma glucosiphilum]PWN22079.1 hypothetical protein BCV69DRAFT_297386 [Pseudomicrostroma glucosiphilum]